MISTKQNWQNILQEESSKSYFTALLAKIKKEEKAGICILPIEAARLKALECCAFDKVKVVILGQDPYYNTEKAMGLAFSVPSFVPAPPTLKNIFKELYSDLGICHETPNLKGWAKQGVLLLNTILTVEEGKPGSHSTWGWEIFTDRILTELDKSPQPIAFILWGKIAQKKEQLLKNPNHLILKSPHPSPLGAYRGFFGSKPFSQANNYLVANGLKPIDWNK